MELQLYNNLTRRKEIFKPIKKNKVNLFVCGPTVYDFSHIGHAKTYVQFDIIVKYLRYLKYKVFYLQNITDVDNKIIQRAREKNISWKELAKRYEEGERNMMEAYCAGHARAVGATARVRNVRRLQSI